MKPFHSFAMLAAIAAVGQAFAVDATTTPVGYESLPLTAGFNYVGLRLQSPVVVAGKLTAVTATSISDSSVNFGTLLTGTSTYILEVTNANGVTQEFLGSSASGSTITLPVDLTSKAAVNDSYKIRAAATLNSVFGASNSAGLGTGFFGPGTDLVYLPNGAGGFDQYYYDDGQATWADINANPVNGAQVAIPYSDSVILSLGAPVNLVVSGEVKTTATAYALTANSFNYTGSVYPAGSTLASAFNAALPNIDKGFFGPAGDIFYVSNGAGGFNQYYYDDGQASWADINANPVDATTISLPSGVVIYNDGAAANLVASAPASYSSL
ncbi:hypothetical protein KBB96_18850 [Luteolibacter ambystomatis]|uniref:DUF4394 domain-containing protein n=1 Tax=Luteolibacter ambystomatis TaxID=2824561 RepID=A0A975G8W0_9BACT|nr:hypothetical protein [Luteolibacter ambystomatis]QUE50906.1 hypothetical protein KBB96_18850 [Luteolibacter ambystomatis]